MTDKRNPQQAAATTGTTVPRRAPAAPDRQPPRVLPEAPPDDGPTTGAISPVAAENEDPAINRDNDRGTRLPR